MCFHNPARAAKAYCTSARRRGFSSSADVYKRQILDYTEKFDKLRLNGIAVAKEEIKAAYGKVSPETIENLNFSAKRIQDFAEHQKSCLKEFSYEISPGVTLGHRIIPIESCGCYVPAGRYPLPSSCLLYTSRCV